MCSEEEEWPVGEEVRRSCWVGFAMELEETHCFPFCLWRPAAWCSCIMWLMEAPPTTSLLSPGSEASASGVCRENASVALQLTTPNQTQSEMENSAVVLADFEGTCWNCTRPASPTCKVVRSCWSVTFLMSDGLLRRNKRRNWNQPVCLHSHQWDNMVHIPSSQEQAIRRRDVVKWCHDSE